MVVLSNEQKATEGKTEEQLEADEKAAQEALYPKSEEQLAADKVEEEKKAAEGKTEEELAAEKKEADEKAAQEKIDDEKKVEEKKAEEAKLEKAKAEGLATVEDLKFPEGIPVNEGIRDELLSIVNDKDMTPVDRAQAIVNLQQKLYVAQGEAHEEQVAKWEKEVAEDKEIIGDTGDKMEENLAIAKKGMEALKVEGLSELLRTTGFGSHPLFAKMFYRIGASVSEDSFTLGSKGGLPTEKTQAEILYSNDVPK